jgi:hypothetical protein
MQIKTQSYKSRGCMHVDIGVRRELLQKFSLNCLEGASLSASDLGGYISIKILLCIAFSNCLSVFTHEWEI